MPSPVAHRDVTTKEQPGSPHYQYRNGQDAIERKFRGLFADLLIQRAGAWSDRAIMPDMPAGFTIETVDLKADRGPQGLGTATISLTNWASLPDAVYDCEWVEVQRDLLTHERYRPGAGGAAELTPTDLVQIELWKREPDYTRRKDYKFVNWVRSLDGELETGTEVTLSANAQDYAAEYLAGEDSYTDWYPVLTATTYYWSRPSLTGGGTIEVPPATAGKPAGYVWRKAPDKRSWNKRFWTKRQQWVGAKAWNTKFYS